MALIGGVPGCGSGYRCHFPDLPVGQRRQAGEYVAQIALWVDAAAATGFDDREQYGAALACFGFADEQPVLFADGALDAVVVDLDAPDFEMRGEHWRLRQRVVDGAAHGTAWPLIAAEFESGGGSVDALGDHEALA